MPWGQILSFWSRPLFAEGKQNFDSIVTLKSVSPYNLYLQCHVFTVWQMSHQMFQYSITYQRFAILKNILFMCFILFFLFIYFFFFLLWKHSWLCDSGSAVTQKKLKALKSNMKMFEWCMLDENVSCLSSGICTWR